MSLSAVLQAGYRVIRFPYLLSPSNMVKKKQEMLSVRQELNGFTEPMTNQKSSDLCFNAAEYLISKDNIDRESIDGLVVLTVTRDWALPDTSVYLQHKLGLKNETVCLDINYGCTGYIYGLMQAVHVDTLVDYVRIVLVLGGDIAEELSLTLKLLVVLMRAI